MKIDLHIHSTYSDGCCSPEEIASRAKAVGLHGFAITDHNKIGGWKRAAEAAKELRMLFVPGKEIAIWKGKEKYGEILALFMNEDTKANNTLDNLEEIIDEIKEQDGIVGIPHPVGDSIRVQKITDYVFKHRIKIDAIETINGRCSAIQNAKSMELAFNKKTGQIGGSDAHHVREIGSVYTFAEAYDLEEFRKYIKKGLSKAIGIQKSQTEINYNRLLCRFHHMFHKPKLEQYGELEAKRNSSF